MRADLSNSHLLNLTQTHFIKYATDDKTGTIQARAVKSTYKQATNRH